MRCANALFEEYVRFWWFVVFLLCGVKVNLWIERVHLVVKLIYFRFSQVGYTSSSKRLQNINTKTRLDDTNIYCSWWTHWAISRSSQCSTTGVTKAVVCIILSVGWFIKKKEPLLLIGKSSPGFLSRYLRGPLPYVWRHIAVNKMCCVRR